MMMFWTRLWRATITSVLFLGLLLAAQGKPVWGNEPRIFYVNNQIGQDQQAGLSARLEGPIGPKATIQAAIGAAQDGDVIVLAPGCYYGTGNRDIVFEGKSLTIRSEYGPQTCVIDAEGSAQEPHRGFVITESDQGDITLEGITIMNGWAKRGGAIYCQQSQLVIRDCVIRNNIAANYGGGLYFEGGQGASFQPLIENNQIYENFCYGPGGGIGVYFDNMHPVMRNNLVVGNRSFNRGGGISIFTPNGRASLTNNTICHNQAPAGGGLYLEATAGTTLVNSIVWGNTAAEGAELMVAKFGDVYPSHISIERSLVGEDPADIPVDARCSLSWDDDNIVADPCFVEPGYWQDAQFVMGDYRLQSASWCIDEGQRPALDTVAGDALGQPRMTGEEVDLGAVEFRTAEELAISRLRIRKGDTFAGDSLWLTAVWKGEPNQTPATAGVRIQVGSQTWTIPAEVFAQQKGPIFRYAQRGSPSTRLYINMRTHYVSLLAHGLDLTGTTLPVAVELDLGDYFASAVADEALLNKTGFLPLGLWRGFQNGLRIEKITASGRKKDRANLLLQGSIVTREVSIRPGIEGVTLDWGGGQETIRGADWMPTGSALWYRRDPKTGRGQVRWMMMDGRRAKFLIMLENVPTLAPAEEMSLRVAFNGFDETAGYSF